MTHMGSELNGNAANPSGQMAQGPNNNETNQCGEAAQGNNTSVNQQVSYVAGQSLSTNPMGKCADVGNPSNHMDPRMNNNPIDQQSVNVGNPSNQMHPSMNNNPIGQQSANVGNPSNQMYPTMNNNPVGQQSVNVRNPSNQMNPSMNNNPTGQQSVNAGNPSNQMHPSMNNNPIGQQSENVGNPSNQMYPTMNNNPTSQLVRQPAPNGMPQAHQMEYNSTANPMSQHCHTGGAHPTQMAQNMTNHPTTQQGPKTAHHPNHMLPRTNHPAGQTNGNQPTHMTRNSTGAQLPYHSAHNFMSPPHHAEPRMQGSVPPLRFAQRVALGPATEVPTRVQPQYTNATSYNPPPPQAPQAPQTAQAPRRRASYGGPLWAQDLDESQRTAVAYPFSKPLIVLAGPGSGKTHFLMNRIFRFLVEHDQGTIYAVTFTAKAAREMQMRVGQLLHKMPVKRSDRVWVGTIHRLCLTFLNKFHCELGHNSRIRVAPVRTQKIVVDMLLARYQGMRRAGNWEDGEAPEDDEDDEGGEAIPRASEEELRKIVGKFRKMSRYPDFAQAQNMDIQRMFTDYQKAMRERHMLDVNDVVPMMREALKLPVVLQYVHNAVGTLLVDEFQDTDPEQVRLFQDLAPDRTTVVGDDDQMIYGWRTMKDRGDGNSSENPFNLFILLNLERVEQHTLINNYRSTPEIVKFAQSVIRCNKRRADKEIIAVRAGAPNSVQVRVKNSFALEMGWVVREITTAAQRGRNKDDSPCWSRYAVLLRLNSTVRQYEQAFEQAGAPVKGAKVGQWDRSSLSFLAYLRLGVNQHDDASFVQICNNPSRGLGPKFLEDLQKCAGTSYWEKSTSYVRENHSRQANNLRNFMSIMLSLAKRVTRPDFYAIDALTYVHVVTTWHISLGLRQAATQQQTVQDFLFNHHIPRPNNVSVMTIHSAKGLEWDTVFVPQVSEGMVPLNNSTDIEEDRRLLYVACTRAKCQLVVSAGSTMPDGNPTLPSRFLSEIGAI